jgi:alpha-glucosidase
MGGFSTGAKAWLPVAPEHLNLAAARQSGNAGSMLEHYRAALAFRRAHPALRDGAQSGMAVAGDVVSFRRGAEAAAMFCAFNLGEGTSTVDLPPGAWQDAGQTIGSVPVTGRTITLGPWQYCLATIQAH